MAVREENANCDLWGSHAKLCWPKGTRWKDVNNSGFRYSDSGVFYYYSFALLSGWCGQEWEKCEII